MSQRNTLAIKLPHGTIVTLGSTSERVVLLHYSVGMGHRMAQRLSDGVMIIISSFERVTVFEEAPCPICNGKGTLPDLPVTVTCICKLPTLTHHKGLG